MSTAWSTNGYHVNIGAFEHSFEIVVRLARKLGRKFLGFIDRSVMASNQLRPFDFRDCFRMKFGNHAATNNSETRSQDDSPRNEDVE